VSGGKQTRPTGATARSRAGTILVALGVGAGVAVLAPGAPWCGAGAQPPDAGSAILSWSADERVTNLPRLDAPETAVYLTVDTAQPIDSLGFQLRWAARRPDGRVSVLGLRAVAGETQVPWQIVPKSEQMAFRTFRALDEWLSDPGYLASIREEVPGGGSRYRIAIAMAVERLAAARIEANGVTVRHVDGTIRQLGSPGVSVGQGWTLQHPPLVSTVTGALNFRYLQSRIRIAGADLDRISEILLVDATGKRFHPIRFDSRSPEQIEMSFANRVIGMGLARLVFRDPNCVADSLGNAVDVAVLEDRQPGDTNAGVVPGRE
jgi:hypothetical protein